MLKNRNCQIPNGLRWYCPVLKYESPPNSSFRVICEGYAQAIRANFGKAKAAGLPTTMTEIENAVDLYNSAICKQNGWTQYLQEGPSQQAPFSRPRPFNSLPQKQKSGIAVARNVAAGSVTVIKWLASGAEAVPMELAEKRAAICAICPVNSKNQPELSGKDLSHWFTVPAQAAIRKALDQLKNMKLDTSVHDKLGVCQSCDCPIPLKVVMPLEKFYDAMTAQAKGDLDPACWIRAEASAAVVEHAKTTLEKP